jgi:hypothetical protein
VQPQGVPSVLVAIAAVLSDIQRFAKFVPRRNSPDVAW